MSDFVPRTDDGLLAFVTPFSTKITATPTAFGCTAGQATALAGLVTGFTTKLATSTDPATRGPAAILAKDDARALLVIQVRALARQINGTQTVSNEQRQALGLTIRHQRQPIPAPATSPVMEITGVSGRVVSVKMHDADSTKRGRPPGVAGAAIFSYVGATPPANTAAWKFESNTTHVVFDVVFDSALAPGTTVWVTSFWYNAKAQSGPACEPITTTFGAAGVSNLAA